MTGRFNGTDGRGTPSTAPLLELLTVAEIALSLKVSEQTVRRWLKARQLKHQRCGRQIRVYRHDLEAFMSAQ
jgi:excisionase family DNA binding protein